MLFYLRSLGEGFTEVYCLPHHLPRMHTCISTEDQLEFHTEQLFGELRTLIMDYTGNM